MNINYHIFLYCGIGAVMTMICLYIIESIFIKLCNTNEERKKINTLVKLLEISSIGVWIIITVIFFGTNPIIHMEEQDSLGENIMQEELNTYEPKNIDIIEKNNNEILNKEVEKYVNELKEKDKESADDYNKFLDSIKKEKNQ